MSQGEGTIFPYPPTSALCTAAETSTTAASAGIDAGPSQAQRNSLKGMESIVLDLVFKESSGDQWASWLELPTEMAASAGKNALVTSLMRAGAPVGRALGKYIENGNLEMVELILNERQDAYEDFTIGEGQGDSPIHFAAWLGQEDIVTSLLRRRVDLDLLGNHGRTPLHLAALRGHFGAVQSLLRAGASVDLHDSDGETVLGMAARHGHIEIVRSIIRHGADVNAVERPLMDITILHSVAIGGDVLLPVIEALLEAGADANVSSVVEMTPLHLAVYVGSIEVVRALLRRGANTNVRNTEGLAPLHYAASASGGKDSAACLELLLRNGAEVNARDDEGRTPLHHAAFVAGGEGGAAVGVDLLLRWGGDETILTEGDGKTPADMIGQGIQEPRFQLGDYNRVSELLANATADRAWRRRLPLVICRAHPDRVRLSASVRRNCSGSSRRSRKVARRGERSPGSGLRGVEECSAGDGSDARDGFRDLAATILTLDSEDVFRKIVTFL